MVLQRIIPVQIETPGSMQFYKELLAFYQLYLPKNEHICIFYFLVSVYVVLQRIILVQIETPGSIWFYKKIKLVQIETPGSMWFYKESYWYKWRFQCLCGSTKNDTGTNRASRV
jgi:hypothetical protein